LHIETLLALGVKSQRINWLDMQCNYMNIEKENNITAILFESEIYDINEASKLIKDYTYNIKKDINPSLNIEKENIITAIEKFNSVVEISQMLFSEETIKFLETRITENWLDENFIKTFMKLNAIKKWQTDNLSTLDQHTFILLDEATIGTLGIRNINKIRGLIYKGDEDMIYDEAFNPETRIPFLKIGMPDTKNWSPLLQEEYKNIFNGEWTSDQFIYSNNYYYWNGLKIMTLINAIEYKGHRYELTDYIDFVSMRDMYNIECQITIEINLVNSGQHNIIKNLLTRFLKYNKINLQSILQYDV
jgi:hypothetical protein